VAKSTVEAASWCNWWHDVTEERSSISPAS